MTIVNSWKVKPGEIVTVWRFPSNSGIKIYPYGDDPPKVLSRSKNPQIKIAVPGTHIECAFRGYVRDATLVGPGRIDQVVHNGEMFFRFVIDCREVL